MQSLIVIVLVGTFAFAVSAVCGGGAGLLLLPLLGMALPTPQVPAALSLGTATSSVSRLLIFRGSIHWGLSRRFIPAALPVCWLGVWMLSRLNPVYVELGLGFFLISNLSLLFQGQEERFQTDFRPEGWRSAVVGALAGFISGLTGAVGVLFNGFYFRCGLSKDQIVATRAANEVLLHLLKLYLYWRYGLLTRSALQVGLAVAFSAIAANRLIKVMLGLVSDRAFRRCGYAAMVLSGFLMVTGSLHKLGVENQVQAGFHRSREGHLEAEVLWSNSQFIEVDFQELEIESHFFGTRG